jgi:Zn-dependent protease with chaperone function
MRVVAAVAASELLEVAWVSLVAGVAVTVLFSLVVLFTSRSAEARRASHGGAAVAYAGLAVVTFVVFGGLVVFGAQIMLTKG